MARSYGYSYGFSHKGGPPIFVEDILSRLALAYQGQTPLLLTVCDDRGSVERLSLVHERLPAFQTIPDRSELLSLPTNNKITIR